MDTTIKHTEHRQNHQPRDPMSQVYKAEARVAKASTVTSITFTTPTTGTVKSSDGKRDYHFSLPDFCECPDNQFRGNICYHLIAAKQKADGNIELPLENNLIQKELLE